MVELVLPSQAQSLKLKRWRVSTFWVMLVGYIGYYICRQNLSAALPLMAIEFNYTNTQLGIIFTFSELCYSLGKFVNGPLADKVGGKKIFILGMLGAIVFNLVFTLASSILMFTVIWCCTRYFLSMGWGGLIKTMGAWYEPEKNGRIMGLVSINYQAGGGLAMLFCGFLLSIGFGWKGMFIVPALTLFVIMIWAMFASKESPQAVIAHVKFGQNAGRRQSVAEFKQSDDQKASVRDILKTLIKQPIFQQLMIFSFMTTFLRTVFVFWTAKFMVDIGMDVSGAIMKSSVFPFLGIAGTLSLGWYTDRYAKNGDRAKAMWITLVGLVCSLLAISFLISSNSHYPNVIVALVGACGFFLFGPYSMTSGCLSLDIAGSYGGGSCTGVLDGTGYLGGALAAWGAGYISDLLGWGEVFLLLSGIALLAVLSAFRLSILFQRRAKKFDGSSSDLKSTPIQQPAH